MTRPLHRRARVLRVFLIELVALVALVLLSRAAHADEALARQHFRRGVDLYDKKQFAEAESAFRDAYREKPSAGIKQNIALCLRGQNKLADAATMLDEALDEGKSSLKPETRAAIERELAELAKQVGTVVIKVVFADDKRAADDAVVTVDDKAVDWRRPIRVTTDRPHVFRAHVKGYPDPTPKRLAPAEGELVDATFEVAAGTGTLNITPSVEDALVKIDGIEAGRGRVQTTLGHGPHVVEASAPDHQTTTVEITVTAGTTVEYNIVLPPASEVPPPYVAKPPPPPKKPKTFYVALMLSFHGASYRLAPGLLEAPDGKRRGFGGVGFGIKGGVPLSRFFAAELHIESGTMSASYKLRENDSIDSKTTVTNNLVTPVIRFTSPGTLRFTSGAGIGVHSLAVKGDLYDRGTSRAPSGAAFSAAFLLDGGLQVDAGPVVFEGVLFFHVHDVRGPKDDGVRLLQASPATRIGVRLGLGMRF